MNTIEYIARVGLSGLHNELHVKYKKHAEWPIVILNYDQGRSPKKHVVVRECRQLLLEFVNGVFTMDPCMTRVIGRSFTRFFNVNEDQEETSYVVNHMGEATFETKHDGSLIQLFRYGNQWNVATRNSFGEGSIVEEGSTTWIQMVLTLLPITKHFFMNPDYSYCFELCSPLNKVVREYKQDQLFLLAGFKLSNGEELNDYALDVLAAELCVGRPVVYMVGTMKEAMEVIKMESCDFEGMVVKISAPNDQHVLRVKIKNPTYLELHHRMVGPMTWKRFVPIYLENEQDEYHQEWTIKMNVLLEDVMREWEKFKSIQTKSELAKSIKEHPYKYVFFSLFGRTLPVDLHFWNSQTKWLLLQYE
jgi:hypothetical protein